MIKEYDKVRLKTGEIVRIVEVLEENAAYVAEIFKKGVGISIEQIDFKDIASVFEEIERPLAKAV